MIQPHSGAVNTTTTRYDLISVKTYVKIPLATSSVYERPLPEAPR
jgi:hypothetical protein